jgi:hypothetical protein
LAQARHAFLSEARVGDVEQPTEIYFEFFLADIWGCHSLCVRAVATASVAGMHGEHSKIHASIKL